MPAKTIPQKKLEAFCPNRGKSEERRFDEGYERGMNDVQPEVLRTLALCRRCAIFFKAHLRHVFPDNFYVLFVAQVVFGGDFSKKIAIRGIGTPPDGKYGKKVVPAGRSPGRGTLYGYSTVTEMVVASLLP